MAAAGADRGQTITAEQIVCDPAPTALADPVAGGPLHHVQATGPVRFDYSARITVDRPTPDLATLPAAAVADLPPLALRALMPSRYCPWEAFETFVATEFAGLLGGARIAAMRDWIATHLSYTPGASGPHTTAVDTFAQRQGVCRDYAHLQVAFARAAGIPALYVSAYGPDVTPQDFHALAAVYLSGGWHLVDPTGMTTPSETVVIATGADAAECAFLTSYTPLTFRAQNVSVSRT